MFQFLKKIRKRSACITLLAIVVTTTLLGCGSSTKTVAKNPSVKEIVEKVKQSSDISNLKEGDVAKLKKLYKINSEDIEEFALYTASSNIKVDELLIIKLKNSEKANDVKDSITKRIEKQSTSFKDYLPDEYFIIQKNVVKVKDKYVIFVISKDAEKISKAFDESFK